MTYEERLRFIDRELKGLWPQWGPTDAEVCVWTSELASFDYGWARLAAQACFRAQGANYQRPVLSKFLEHARALARPARRGPRERRDPTTNVFVECLDPPGHHPHLAGARLAVFTARQDDPEHVNACAESMRIKCAQLYGGHWITVVTRPQPDDGLWGAPAEQRAFERLLTGPDTPGQRWLQALLARRAKPAEPAVQDEPHVADACQAARLSSAVRTE